MNNVKHKSRAFSLIWSRQDLYYLLFLILWTVSLNAPGLNELQFFRHTEADRTLISWEMAESGNYLVPQLLGSTILSKPPLYYWVTAAILKIAHSTDEWAARLTSLLASVLFICVQFYFLCRIGLPRLWSFASALCLSTSLQFMILAQVAEIDMLFGLCSTLTIYALFIAMVELSLSWFVLSYLFLTAAFLTKGVPVLIYFFLVQVIFLLIQGRCRIEVDERLAERSLLRIILFNFLGATVFFIGCAAWVLPLAKQVGWSVLQLEIETEIINRVIADENHLRGPLFYIGTFFGVTAPWSLFILLWVGWFSASSELRQSVRAQLFKSKFLLFNLIVLFAVIFPHSLSAGKSSRYIFAIQPFAINLGLFCATSISKATWKSQLFSLSRYISLSGILLCLTLPFFLKLEGVTITQLISSSVIMGLVLIVLYNSSARKSGAQVMVSLLLVMFAVRYGQNHIYAPNRNAIYTVKPVATDINQLVPQTLPIYTIEFFDRWVNYYLKRLDRQSYRLTPQRANELSKSETPVYLLLSQEEEWWRYLQLRQLDPSTKLVKTYPGKKDSYLIVKTSSKNLSRLILHERFPTFPTIPLSLKVAKHSKFVASYWSTIC